MALPARPHTFALETCRDVLAKLEWEIAGIEAEQDMPDLAFRAFNCAVTAWHLADWVWNALGRKRRRAWGNDEEKFKKDCRDKCAALKHCWLIANASKHGGIDVKKKQIETTVLAEEPRPFRAGAGRAGDPLVEYRWRITVGDRQKSEQDALEVFEAALNFWTGMIYREQLE